MTNTDIDRIWILAARKLMGEASETETKELESLLELHPDQAHFLSSSIKIWNKDAGKDDEFLEATYLAHLERMKEKGHSLYNADLNPPAILSEKKNRRRLTYFLLPAAIVLVAVAAWKLATSGSKDKETASVPVAGTKSEISTRNGNRTRIQLPDGSAVWLNAGSKLNYDKDFGNTVREVQLTGEGYFDVVRNPEKPFIIHTSSIDVKVLGTQFNVKSYPGDKTTETSLIKGSVEVFVKNRGEKWILRPNEKLVVENDLTASKPVKQEADKVKQVIKREPLVAIKELTYYRPDAIIPVEASWTRNELSFKDESFAEVALKMERWYDVQFEFKNKALEKLMMYGTFTNETLEKALEALQYSFNFHYTIKDNKVIIN